MTFRLLDIDGVRTLLKWAATEGWNPGRYDAEVFWATDPEGFYGCFHKGELIAGGSIVSYSNGAFGFMGLFLVKPEYRSKGIGRTLWHQRKEALLARLHPGATIGMDGVVAMQPFYEKGGFQIAFRDERYELTGQAFDIDARITSIEKDDEDDVLAYDRQCFGFSRAQFLRPWLRLPGSKCFTFIALGKLQGFAILRKVHTGYKICPLFADNQEVAEELYKACLNAALGEPVYLDVPVINEGAVSMARKFKARYVFECARMYHGDPPQIPLDKVFGITTFELG